MIQPVFIASMMSLWSPRMSRGPDTARVTMLNTIGNRSPDWTGSCSKANRSPFAEVALNTRPPAVLPVARDHPDGVLPLRLHRVEGLGDLRRGRDGVVPHDVVVDLLGRRRRDLVAALHDHRLGGAFARLLRRLRHSLSPYGFEKIVISGTCALR